MRKINCIVVDDQKDSVELICKHLDKIPEFSIKLATTNPIEALEFLGKKKIDCIFLDIEMPDLNGLEFIETLKEKSGKNIPTIVLITGYGDYAVKGFDYGVFDYLLKPISLKRFIQCTDKLKERFSKENEDSSDSHGFTFFEVDGIKIKINLKDIYYAEANGNYTYIITTLKKHIVYKSLKSVHEQLPQEKFIRVHKSFIISVEHITLIEKDEIQLQIGDTTKRIPLGETYRESVFRSLNIIK